MPRPLTLGEKAADRIASIGRSWPFLIGLNGFIIGWAILNHMMGGKAFDPFPFILLNLFLSWLASVQAPIIMMSQGRQDDMERKRSERIELIGKATLEMMQAMQLLLKDNAEMLKVSLMELEEKIDDLDE